MISLDLSKFVHPRFWNLVPAFMPGLFFEICILCSRPDEVYKIASRAHLDRYSFVLVALILAFIVGNAFMFWVNLIQDILGLAYRYGKSGWRALILYLMRAKGSPPRPSWFASSKLANKAFRNIMVDSDLQDVMRAWEKAANVLLKRRYNIEPIDPLHPTEWKAWHWALGTSKSDAFRRGMLLAWTTQATGWSAAAAAYLAPALRNRPFIVFSLFLILYGMAASWRFARWWNLPELRALMRLRDVLDEIPPPPGEHEKKDDLTTS